ncbi:MAG TPA: Uma2 family endonuclease [Anaerolineae bacterium]|nr:Uma2 family endonuclease [Anaerolineae bacterium]HQI84643.1 Uma2 family endonuclease [Anaerolineae bacterium]
MTTAIAVPQTRQRVSARPVPRVTAQVFAQMRYPEQRTELIKGEVAVMSPASVEHGKITMRIGARLEAYASRVGVGQVYAAETGFIIGRNPDTVRAPDVAFVRQERVADMEDTTGFGRFAPDLAVEVVSPNDSAAYLRRKVSDWLQAGAQQVWVIYPDTATVEVHLPNRRAYTLTGEDTLEGGELLPGFTCPVAEIFA